MADLVKVEIMSGRACVDAISLGVGKVGVLTTARVCEED